LARLRMPPRRRRTPPQRVPDNAHAETYESK
jgi:hypothetical protein